MNQDKLPGVLVLTSFNLNGYTLYGKNFINSFMLNWPASVGLLVASEDEEVINCLKEEYPRLQTVSITSKKYLRFRRRYEKFNGRMRPMRNRILLKKTEYNYKYDAMKFSNKPFALLASKSQWDNFRFLLWIDGDTVFHSKIEHDSLIDICESSGDVGYLGRSRKHSECGIMCFRLTNRSVRLMIKCLAMTYQVGLFRLASEYHDSYLFDRIRLLFSRMPKKMLFKNWNEIDADSHPLINSVWGAYLDHLKGARKLRGSSESTDLEIERQEDYWRKTLRDN